MRKIVFAMQVSVDGFFEGPDGDLSWHAVDEELHAHFNDVYRRAGAFLEGRRMYELMAAFWPTADEDPTNPPTVREYAGIWRSVPKYVYSTTLLDDEVQWNSTVVHEIDVDSVQALKAEEGGDLYLGGAGLGAAFLDHGLIDEFALYVHPTVLGDGHPLFPPGRRIPLSLIETRPFGNGVVLHRYRVA